LNRTSLLLGGAAALVGLGVFVWLAFGGFDVAASRPHSRLTYGVIHAVLVRTVQARSADVAAPPTLGPERIIAGFRQYNAECVRCHGAPGVARDTWADWMNPSPPYLMDASQHFDARQLFWLVCHGAKMTGMPAWGSHRTDNDIWDLVAFLRALPYVPPSGYAALRRAYAGPDPAGGAARPDAHCLSQP